MRAASSAECVFDVPAGIRAGMIVLGWIPAAHIAVAALPIVLSLRRGDWRWIAVTPVVLYLLPPIAVRITQWWRPLPSGRAELASGSFLRWWATAQWQMVFARLPSLEEALRLVPGLYSAWLRLWGAAVGSLVYWSPGIIVLDRSLVDIGDRVAFGSGVRVSPHVIAPGPDGRAALFIGRISIGADALIGAYSILLPGCEIAAGEVTPPLRSIHAFSRFERGRRLRRADLPSIPDVEEADVP